MAARKTTDLTALTTPTANTLVPAVDLTEALPSNQNKKLALSDLTQGLSAATTGAAGVVQLSASTSSTSTSLAATPSAVKSAYDLAAAALPRSGGTMTGAITFAGAQPTATTSAAGIVQLNDTTASTSTTQAATANSVKTSYDLANAALPKSGGTMTGVITYASAQPRLVQGTAQNSTSGATLDFTSIPSWINRITVSFAGISTTGTSPIIIQLGTASSFETSSYLGTSGYIQSGSQSLTSNLSSGVILIRDNAAANVSHGSVVFTLVSSSSNTWAAYGVLANSNNAVPSMVAGSKALAGTLTRVRITTVGGTDTFDAGVVNILYEG